MGGQGAHVTPLPSLADAAHPPHPLSHTGHPSSTPSHNPTCTHRFIDAPEYYEGTLEEPLNLVMVTIDPPRVGLGRAGQGRACHGLGLRDVLEQKWLPHRKRLTSFHLCVYTHVQRPADWAALNEKYGESEQMVRWHVTALSFQVRERPWC